MIVQANGVELCVERDTATVIDRASGKHAPGTRLDAPSV
jgi:hypothetical protein